MKGITKIFKKSKSKKNADLSSQNSFRSTDSRTNNSKPASQSNEPIADPMIIDEVPLTTTPRNHEEQLIMHNKVRERNRNVFAHPLALSDDFIAPDYQKTEAAIKFIDASLADNFIFASLTNRERRSLIDAMMLETVPINTTIIQQGTVGDFFYVVEEGHVSFSVDLNHVGSCSRGASFGELALLYNCPRAATCARPAPRSLAASKTSGPRRRGAWP